VPSPTSYRFANSPAIKYREESAFTESGVDYAVETDKYSGGVIFRSERVGVFFYVLPEAADQARLVMRERGFRFLAE